ncbi:hypothetical protein MJO29_003135 [Puccinia striiformis f. sp. tritici]|uniref:Uncharacterized protein n=1 Tax=Puccinia striiformis TaxID=27350 RepID=A0A2S4UHP0_9BASI|nr:hypothetical protein MJO29_003135 [Puccinia striiformis f. sp. tritici]POV96828.1 hypothetical protein PSTT_15424 [Puccinia striiformis]
MKPGKRYVQTLGHGQESWIREYQKVSSLRCFLASERFFAKMLTCACATLFNDWVLICPEEAGEGDYQGQEWTVI